jgi:hypothetical protein
MLHNSQMTFPNTKLVTHTGFEPAAKVIYDRNFATSNSTLSIHFVYHNCLKDSFEEGIDNRNHEYFWIILRVRPRNHSTLKLIFDFFWGLIAPQGAMLQNYDHRWLWRIWKLWFRWMRISPLPLDLFRSSGRVAPR